MGDLVAQSHGKDPKLQRQLARDTDMTHQLLNEYQQSGRKLKCVELDDEHVKEAHKPQRPSHGIFLSRLSSVSNLHWRSRT